LVPNLWSGWAAPITANTSGVRTTPRYAVTQKTARTASVIDEQPQLTR
jgi:hypothetical protein